MAGFWFLCLYLREEEEEGEDHKVSRVLIDILPNAKKVISMAVLGSTTFFFIAGNIHFPPLILLIPQDIV